MFKKISSRSNSKIKYVKNLISSSKYRKKNNKFIIEGIKICQEAKKSSIKILECFFLKDNKDAEKIANFCKNSYIITEALMNFISDTKTPQGIICICKMFSSQKIFKKTKLLILEDVKDPGNIGTIIRTADAFSFDGIILNKNCCDVYSPKVLRSTMGSIFRIPIILYNDLLYVIKKIKSEDILILVSDANKKNTINIKDVKKNKIAIIVGNESRGVSAKLQRISDKKIHIPISKKCESLNVAVAAGIIMWEMSKNVK